MADEVVFLSAAAIAGFVCWFHLCRKQSHTRTYRTVACGTSPQTAAAVPFPAEVTPLLPPRRSPSPSCSSSSPLNATAPLDSPRVRYQGRWVQDLDLDLRTVGATESDEPYVGGTGRWVQSISALDLQYVPSEPSVAGAPQKARWVPPGQAAQRGGNPRACHLEVLSPRVDAQRRWRGLEASETALRGRLGGSMERAFHELGDQMVKSEKRLRRAVARRLVASTPAGT